MWKPILFAAILFAASTTECSAGVEYDEIPGNLLFPLKQTELELSRLVITVDEDRASVLMIIDNHTQKDITCEVGYPFTAITEPPSGSESDRNDKSRIPLTVGGKEIPFERLSMTPQEKKLVGDEYDYMYKWRLSFKAGEKKTIKYRYRVKWSTIIMYPDGSSLTYVVRPGSLWNGPIGNAEITIKLGDYFANLLKKKNVRLDINPAGYKTVNAHTIQWHFSNWEPSENLVINIWKR